MVDWKRISRRISSKKYRRNALVLSFWGLLLTLVLSIAFSYVVPGETQQSAYGNDWNDLGSFRGELNNLGIPTTALVSSPLLLSEVEHPEESIFIISGDKDPVGGNGKLVRDLYLFLNFPNISNLLYPYLLML